MDELPFFDRFDVCEAYYIFLSQYHDGHARGRFSYGRLSKLLTYFRPAPSLADEDDLSENGRLIYEQLVEALDPDLKKIREQLWLAVEFMWDTVGTSTYWTGDMPACPSLFRPETWGRKNRPIESVWDNFMGELDANGLTETLKLARELPIADLLAASHV